MLVVFWAPQSAKGCLSALVPFGIASAVIMVVCFIGYSVYSQIRIESEYRSHYGQGWQEHYKARYGPVADAHKRYVAAGAGVVAVGTISALLYAQVARTFGSGHVRPRKLKPPGSLPAPRRRRGRSSRGKLWLIFLFFALRAIDPFYYFNVSTEHQAWELAEIAVCAIWTAVFMGAIWNGKDWARYVLTVFLAASLVWDFVLFTSVSALGYSISPFFVAACAIKLLVIWMLTASADIKRLSRGEY